MATKLRRLRIDEGSIVDAGANPLARVMLFKRAYEAKGGSPTSEKPSVLKRLKESVLKMMGMDGSKAMTMDQMMGMQEKESELWEKEWQMRDAFDSSVRSIMDDEAMDMEKKKEMLGQTMEQYHAKLTEHMNAMMELMAEAKGNPGAAEGAVSMSKTQTPPTNVTVNKKEGDTMTLEDILKALKAEERVVIEAALAKSAAPAVPESVTKRIEELEKSAAKVEALEKRATDAETSLAKAQTELNAERETRVAREYLAKAAQYPTSGTPEQVSAKLRKAYGVSEEYGKEIEADLAQKEQLAKDARMFEPVGKYGAATEGSAAGRIEKMARERAAKDNVTYYAAYDRVLQANPDLYRQYRTEEEGK